jgi:hypothetical protein
VKKSELKKMQRASIKEGQSDKEQRRQEMMVKIAKKESKARKG